MKGLQAVVNSEVFMNEKGKKSEGGDGIDYVVRTFFHDTNIQPFLESLAEGLVAVDENQMIVLVNRRLEEMLGYSRDEIVGQPLAILLPHRLAEHHSEHVSGYFAHPRIRPMGQGLDLAARRKDGTEFPIDISLSFMSTDKGRLSLALVTDITQLKEAENDLIQRNDELDAFAHILAHELNGSLSVITGYSQALLEMDDAFLDDEKRDSLDRILKSGYKAADIIRELLHFADMRGKDVELKPLNMSKIVEESLNRLHDKIEKKGAIITLPDSYHDALGYGPWVEEVWVNYMSNALKYGGDPPILELGSSLTNDGFVKFWVRDNGTGLTAQQQAQLFTAHHRLDHPEIEGSGLGLSIVKRIIGKLGGQVGVESERGKGSLFSFTLRGRM